MSSKLFNFVYAAGMGAGGLWVLMKIRYLLMFIAVLFFGHLLWQATCWHPVAVNLPEDGVYFKGIKSKSVVATPIPNVDDSEMVTFQFYGYDVRVKKFVAEWLRDGGLDDPQTELGYMYGKRCKEGLAASCNDAWFHEN